MPLPFKASCEPVATGEPSKAQVPADSTRQSRDSPASSKILLKIALAIGDRQIFAVQMNNTDGKINISLS
jgi:hypothetical protein